ncbi:sodium-dependent bicarbonate transport family permease [Flavihumibacter rivuli]|uniref:sodium-dependent bicarbonate transport family permease n=1 Tax=Flavihumibacter rivuli TaxID=2838156 RepID=UPI001BDDEA0F|nr:sodium-dependent bicarbonate transport family permease [Flavihumibacter rivuli]ULQ56107.1 sodium-dependent bicarbonate transport family permease [Flavihumibacter rivuli]
MNPSIIISNLTNPTLLFFLLGIVAAMIKSDLEIPPQISKFLSLYLLFSIGFKGGMELAHSGLNKEIMLTLGLSIVFSILVPLYTYFILRRKLDVYNAGALAATYGSVSAVTFITATTFLTDKQVPFGGHMVAAMALMESPAIIIGVSLIRWFSNDDTNTNHHSVGSIMKEAFSNGSVLMILGSLVIGIVSDEKQAEGIKPFTSDIFKGFLAVFLLDMGIVAAKRIKAFGKAGWFLTAFGIFIPLINAALAILIAHSLGISDGNAFLLAILAGSASYIAVPAALRLAIPQADPGLYIPMALAITFPFNIVVGIPTYYWLLSVL